MDQQPANRQAALQTILAIHHKHLIRIAGQLIKAPQITQHHLKTHVIANRDHLEIHARANAPLGIRHRGPKLLALFNREALTDFLNHLFRKIGGQCSKIIRLQCFGSSNQLLAVHRRDQGLADRIRNLDKNFSVAFSPHQLPDDQPLFARQGLKDVGDIGRMQLIKPRLQCGLMLFQQELFNQRLAICGNMMLLTMDKITLKTLTREDLLDLGQGQLRGLRVAK